MLKVFAHYAVYSIFDMTQGNRLSDALEFFIYYTITIFFQLAVIIFIVSIIRTYFPPEKTKRILSHKKEFIGNISAMHLMISLHAMQEMGIPLPCRLPSQSAYRCTRTHAGVIPIVYALME